MVVLIIATVLAVKQLKLALLVESREVKNRKDFSNGSDKGTGGGFLRLLPVLVWSADNP